MTTEWSDARSTHPGTSGFRILAGVLVVGTTLAGGCAKKNSVVEPPPVQPGVVRVEGNRILWSTDRDARATVRYSYTRGSWDHNAYPNAAGRLDLDERLEHDIALLDVRPGQRLYFQAVSEASGQVALAAIDSFVPTVAPSRPLLTSTMIHIGFGDSHLRRCRRRASVF
jgi:hypothetical protein